MDPAFCRGTEDGIRTLFIQLKGKANTKKLFSAARTVYIFQPVSDFPGDTV